MARFEVIEVRDPSTGVPGLYVMDTRLTFSGDTAKTYVKPCQGVNAADVAAALNFWWDAND